MFIAAAPRFINETQPKQFQERERERDIAMEIT